MSDARRPDALPDDAVEPRAGDLVQFRHRDAAPQFFRVAATNRHPDRENDYTFVAVSGDQCVSMPESAFADLFTTDRSAEWPVVYAAVDFHHRRRDADTDGVTYFGEPLDAAKTRAKERELE